MANIRALAKGLLAGRGRGRGKAKVGGWLRVDPDHVIRGWARDAERPVARLTVRLFIDLKPAAEIVADRLDPKLVEQGHGDGRHAFAYVVPQAFRDGREHAFEAVVEAAGYRLMSKDKTFAIEAAASAPRLSLLEVTPTGLRARLKGARVSDAELELWNGGRRIEGIETTRTGQGPQAELHLAWPPALFAELGEDAVVAVPGMVEAGTGFARLSAALGRSASPAEAQEPEDGEPANLVRNAELNDWPYGVIVRGGPGRFELALGWHAQNRKGHASVRAFATPLDFEGEDCSLTLAVAEVADYLRLEAEIEGRPAAGRTLDLSFEAAIAQGPTGAFQSTEPFLLIDRVFLKGEEGSATIARNVVLTRQMRRFAFRFEAPAELTGAAVLAFDFKRPVAVTLQRPHLGFTPPGAPELETPLAFEDAGLEAQVGLVEGLGSWASPQVLEPPAPDPGPGEASPPAAGAPHPLGAVEVVVCVHDAAEETLACLASLAACTPLPHRVRIVDDASGEETVARIAAFVADKPWMKLDPNPGHLGYTASANRGVRAAGADWVVLLNSDTVVTPGWLEGLLEAAGSRECVGMAGPLSNAASWQSVPDLHDRAGKFKTNELAPGWTPARMAELVAGASARALPEVPLLNGFCTLIRREAFIQLGGFNEAAFPTGYGEETDLCLRMTAAGWRLVVADQVYVHHAKSASFGAERRAALQAEGMAALKRLHPGADFAAMGERMRETIPLILMRNAVREALKGQA
jgi:GT2 family glycosyltransferase